ncbi:porin family protein [Shewanella sp. SW36]|uniref:porin family protein n=1 Tax=Shewanella TaxID=22 RepID=UPI0021DA4D12|nr:MULTISPECIES: porin family protein [unclassified Shewanella]MCU7977432.1 porin family protein [Shewanella sp. SW36]MCU7992689.1 porin family protein [Shewanella sp. SW1]MCU8018761.1 porin family protein [Shewanella sp. SM72]MCU8042313.1 porin family protein [Shewanella sp. SM68]MCU8046052.1 porin family protein [Shewanella sp. SM65]
MKRLFILLALLISTTASSADETHGFSAGLGLGLTEDYGGITHYDFAYRYQFTPDWGVEVGYTPFQSEPFTAAIHGVFDDYILENSYSSRLTGTYTYQISARHNAIFKAGLSQSKANYQLNDYGNSGDDVITIDEYSDDGYGLYAALGWRCRFYNGFEIMTTLAYQDSGVFEMTSFTVGIGYSF